MQKALVGTALLALLAGCGGDDDGANDAAVADERDASMKSLADATMPTDIGPIDVPMTVETGETGYSGSHRFGVSVQVGGWPAFNALVDTGSSGLRILPNVLPDAVFTTITGIERGYGYGNTIDLFGVIATAPVKIGEASTGAPIPVMLIRTAQCDGADPGCSVTDELAGHFSGYGAILGVGLRTDDLAPPVVANPISQMPGSPSFVISAPPFPGGTGVLRIAPTAAEVASFATVQLGQYAGQQLLPNGIRPWDDEAIPGCITNVSSDTPYCDSVLVDSGTPTASLLLPANLVGAASFPSGAQVTFTMGPPTAPVFTDSFTVGATPQSGLDKVTVYETTGSPTLNSGTTAFFKYDVLFDARHGLIGFSSH